MTELTLMLSSSTVVKKTEIRIKTIAVLLSEIGGILSKITFEHEYNSRRSWFVFWILIYQHLEFHQEFYKDVKCKIHKKERRL